MLGLFLAGILALIIGTWGSIASAVLTLALLGGLSLLPIKWFLEVRDGDDYQMED